MPYIEWTWEHVSRFIADGTLRSETVPGLDFHHDSSDGFAGVLGHFEGGRFTGNG